jgi:REP element-mobilizing transposase RayT
MSELRKANYDSVFFLTLTVVSWVDVFTRRIYNDEIIKSLLFCQQNKGLEIYAYVIMTNHLHMIASQKEGRLNDILRDFKSFTAKQLLNLIYNSGVESREEWMKIIFQYNARFQRKDSENMFWQRTNHPLDCYDERIFFQKMYYIHMNPVKAGYVCEPEHWYYSSANPNSPLKMNEF